MNSLASWSPVVRQRAAQALSRRQDDPVPQLIGLLETDDLFSQLGACQALAQLKSRAAPAVPMLKRTLGFDDLWVRIKAAEVQEIYEIVRLCLNNLPGALGHFGFMQ